MPRLNAKLPRAVDDPGKLPAAGVLPDPVIAGSWLWR
jgi:hypothetical protein